MRLRSTSRVDRLVRRLPRLTVYSALELMLLALIGIQAARLAWTLVTPPGPVGDYRGPAPPNLPAGNVLAEFDPFFRLAGAAQPAAVTSLNLKLFGVREDRATGRGSAIIALPDGSQRSFAVGEEIMPGVTLSEVGFESVTLSRNGAPEQLFLDQSGAAPAAGAPASPGAATGTVPPPGPPPIGSVPAPPAPAAPPVSAIGFQPRVSNGRVDGIIVNPGADAQAFRAAGFEPGDVIVSVNGQRITSSEQARAMLRRAGGSAIVVVNRGGRAVPLVVRLNP